MFEFLKRLFSRQAAAPPVAAPAPPPAIVPPTPAPPEMQRVSQAGDTIPLQLGDIVARLPASLAPLVSPSATGTYRLPVKTALEQLPSGAVRISFGQLRQAFPPGTFAASAGLDETPVDLPLPKILGAMDPALLARRPGQKQVEAPEGISAIFGLNAAAARVAALRVAPAAPAPPPMVAAPKVTPVAQKPPVSASLPAAAPLPVAAQKPAAPAPATAPPVPGKGALTVRLAALCESWPEPVRQEIAQLNWNGASVSLPMSRLEAAVKGGRVVFAWGELIEWLDVSSAAGATRHRETPLELPLKVIVPLFMAQRPIPGPRKHLAVGENVPNLFPAPGQPTAPAVPPPAPVPAPIAAPAIVAATPADVLGEIFGQPGRKDWSPEEITQKINGLPGVAGSLMAMNDGFVVAGALPPPLKSETMAAFLPQIFGRLAHYATEIQLGAPAALTLLAGQTPCAIFKTGALYLAVLGKPGEPLPEALLLRVAGELAKRNP
jgi:predicted regulator of Ras-like GTPase activity (Roadblock/LC7/MglB family)